MAARTFSSAPAQRRPEPVLLGISGPSSSGKTKTALRLATGLVAVSGGPIFFIDTEGGRAAKYAPPEGEGARPPHTFAFEHVAFDPPFNPLSYRDAIAHCEARGAGAIIVDSMSHEHAGEGGRIDSAEKEAQRRAAKWGGSPDKYKFAGFAPNSAERQALLYHLGKRRCHIILCFRAKETAAQEGKEIVDEGFTPIGCDAFVFELDSSILLYPRAAGVPTWKTDKRGEQLCLKLDDLHAGIFNDGRQITEDHGRRLALAAGFAQAAGAGKQAPKARGPLVYDGFEWPPDEPEAITLSPVASMTDADIKTFGQFFRALLERATSPGTALMWCQLNEMTLAAIAGRSPALASWMREPLRSVHGLDLEPNADGAAAGADEPTVATSPTQRATVGAASSATSQGAAP